MKQYPMHDQGGILWPECDHRRVGCGVLAAYLETNYFTARERALAGDLGPAGKASGWMREPRPGRTRALYWFIPAVIWQRRGLGRYASIPGFDPRAVRERLLICDPAETVSRTLGGLPMVGDQPNPARYPDQGSAVITGIALELAGILRRILPAEQRTTPIPFTSANGG